jgi:hypothetical protein
VQANSEVANLGEFQKQEVAHWQQAVRDSGAVNE